MHHDALADLCLGGADPGADRGDDAAGLVPGDHRLSRRRQPADRLAAFLAAVLVEVAAAHPRGLHLDDDLALSRRRIGKFHHFELAIAGKDNPAHLVLPRLASGLWRC